VKLVVAITVNNRPEYLARVLDSWRQVRGIQDVYMVFQVEPDSPECLKMCQEAPFLRRWIVQNRERFGALGNPYKALETGFSLDADFVILGEDDSIVTADILEFFSWAAVVYDPKEIPDDGALTVCSFKQRTLSNYRWVVRRKFFASVVWGTWRSRWEETIAPSWSFDYSPAWDKHLLDLAESDQFYCVFPAVSRSQHIGKFGGTHMNPEHFDELQADEVHDGRPTTYEEVDV